MKDDISLLLEFLDRCGPEVHGCGPAGLRDEQFALIERFIAGRCDDIERRKLSEFLQMHPAWIRWIADRISLERDLEEDSTRSTSDGGQMTA
jgi:hypothetical protein